MDLVLKNGICLIPTEQGEIKRVKLDIGIDQGKIVEISEQINAPSCPVEDCDGLFVLPGLIDTQVHFREPGLTHKEDLEHGSLGAVFGGVTGFFEMPNTKPNTISAQDILSKVHIAEKKSFTDFAFFLGACAENKNHIAEIEKTPGCCGVKIFMGSSTGTLLVDQENDLKAILSSGERRVAVHCEDEERLIARKTEVLNDPDDVHKHPLWRDEQTALLATQRIVRLAKETNRRIHVLHLTTKQEILWLMDNKHSEEIKDHITCECTPQHLTLSAPECYDELGTLAQMNPPIRTKDHQDQLWQGIKNKTIDVIGSDHAPHTLEEKQKPYPHSPSGMTGVQTTVPLMLDHIHHGKLSLERLVELMAHRPREIYKMQDRGMLKKGLKANITVVDLNKEKTITNDWIKSVSGWTPFHGKTVTGWPVMTLVNGKVIVKNDQLIEAKPQGQSIF